MKTCNKCTKEKELTEFYRHNREPSGYRPTCKECTLGHVPYKKPEHEKPCHQCGIIKPLESYYHKLIEGKYKALDGTCKKCRSKNRTLKRKKNKPKEALRVKKLSYRAKFNISLEEYNDMLVNQNSVCKICNKPESVENRSLSVDHCHTNGNIRGLLCTKCNTGLGFFNDNIESLTNAIKYLSDNQVVKII